MARLTRIYSPAALARSRRFGGLVRLARAERGWTQRELAQRLGIGELTVKNIEAGAPGTAFGTVLEVSSLLNISPDPQCEPARELTAGLDLLRRVRKRRLRPELDV